MQYMQYLYMFNSFLLCLTHYTYYLNSFYANVPFSFNSFQFLCCISRRIRARVDTKWNIGLQLVNIVKFPVRIRLIVAGYNHHIFYWIKIMPFATFYFCNVPIPETYSVTFFSNFSLTFFMILWWTYSHFYWPFDGVLKVLRYCSTFIIIFEWMCS